MDRKWSEIQAFKITFSTEYFRLLLLNDKVVTLAL